MKPLTQISGIAAPLMRPNIDTDVIIPSREMKTVTKTGLGIGAFANWRYSDVDAREPNPDFVLNQDRFQAAEILVAGPNFGCGSSREHAVWALKDLGIKAVLAPSFGAIFEKNCVMNGIAPLRLSEQNATALSESLITNHTHLDVDLETLTVRSELGSAPLELTEGYRAMLLNGWDSIGLNLQHANAIEAWQEKADRSFPWIKASLIQS